jgi:hypothetical protein
MTARPTTPLTTASDTGTGPLRVLGAITVAYSVAIIAVPKLLAKPCRMTDVTGGTPMPVRTLIRGIGARDAAIGVAMMVAPPGIALTTATVCRVASDAGDAVAFGIGLPDASTKLKIAGFAVLWAALNAAALKRHAARTAI